MNELTLPWPPKELSPNARLHWAQKAKHAKNYRRACWALTKAANSAAVWDGPIHVRMVFWRPQNRSYDLDNLIASMKSGLDGIAEALGVNDSRFHLHASLSDVMEGVVKIRISETP